MLVARTEQENIAGTTSSHLKFSPFGFFLLFFLFFFYLSVGMFMSTMFIVLLMFIVIDFWVNLSREGQTGRECWECKIYVQV